MRHAPFIPALVCVALFLLAPFAQADPLRAGLLWNKTGLPAVFPLQVRAAKGQAFLMTLYGAQTGKEALAAFVRGGQPFRVLAPPGTYQLRLAKVVEGQDADEAHEVREAFVLPLPLTFEIKDFGTKGGFLVDVTELGDTGAGQIEVSALNICQSYRTSQDYVTARDLGPISFNGTLPPRSDFDASPLDRLAAENELRTVPSKERTKDGRRLRVPRIIVRTRVCG